MLVIESNFIAYQEVWFWGTSGA